MSLACRELRTLAPEGLLLILCIHGSKHLWYRLAWVCDVTRLIAAHPALDWTWVMEQATRVRCVRMLWLGLILACDLLGAAVPEAVRQRARADAVVSSLAAQVQDWQARDIQLDPAGWRALRFHLKARERWPDRVRLCVRLAGDPDAWGLGLCLAPLGPLSTVLRAAAVPLERALSAAETESYAPGAVACGCHPAASSGRPQCSHDRTYPQRPRAARPPIRLAPLTGTTARKSKHPESARLRVFV